MDEIINPTEDKELIKRVRDGEPIYLPNGILLGSDPKHFEKLESFFEGISDNIPDAGDVINYRFSSSVREEFR